MLWIYTAGNIQLTLHSGCIFIASCGYIHYTAHITFRLYKYSKLWIYIQLKLHSGCINIVSSGYIYVQPTLHSGCTVSEYIQYN